MSHTLFNGGILRKTVFDSDGSIFILYRSTNTHICSEEYMFTDKKYDIVSNGVLNIGGKYLIPKEIGTVSLSCTDD